MAPDPTTIVRPVGLMNMFDYFRYKEYRIALWSITAGDWSSRVCQTRLQSKLLDQITGGSVVLLHDSGETVGADSQAPHFMLEALDEVLPQLKTRHLRFVRLDEMA